jgi:hypothetical protein
MDIALAGGDDVGRRREQKSRRRPPHSSTEWHQSSPWCSLNAMPKHPWSQPCEA